MLKSKLLAPTLPTQLIAELEDPDSEISHLVEEKFVNFIYKLLKNGKLSDEQTRQLSQLPSDQQLDKLIELEPDLILKFQTELTKEFAELFKQVQ